MPTKCVIGLLCGVAVLCVTSLAIAQDDLVE